MKRVYPRLSFVLLLAVLAAMISSCASGKKRFERGDYDEAAFQAIKRLKSNPDSKKAAEYLPLAYEHAVNYHLDQIAQAKRSTNQFRYDRVVEHYSKLNQLYNSIQMCPACLELVESPVLYITELDEARTLASKAHFEAGLTALNINTKEGGRQAYYDFVAAKTYTPEYADIDSYIERARLMATYHVVIEDIPVHSRSLAISHEFFQNAIIEFAKGLNYEFVQFYRESEVPTMVAQPDHIIVLQFDDFVVGQTQFKERVIELTKDSVVVGHVEQDGEQIPVYGQAKATYTEYNKLVVSSGLLDFQVVESATGTTLMQRKLPGTFEWGCDWASFNGQEEALSDAQLAAAKRREMQAPPPQDLFVEFTKPIHTQLTTLIRNYYRQLIR